jgi:hypothetical protein
MAGNLSHFGQSLQKQWGGRMVNGSVFQSFMALMYIIFGKLSVFLSCFVGCKIKLQD